MINHHHLSQAFVEIRKKQHVELSYDFASFAGHL